MKKIMLLGVFALSAFINANAAEPILATSSKSSAFTSDSIFVHAKYNDYGGFVKFKNVTQSRENTFWMNPGDERTAGMLTGLFEITFTPYSYVILPMQCRITGPGGFSQKWENIYSGFKIYSLDFSAPGNYTIEVGQTVN
ncbi:hypothetical protein ACTJIJ_11155 [Niabella sp. 22666]|uniref:hypothetical protein n=1 Tax=Niabella sp. 22666 TaxID=3453954 RepID=UPI003F86C2F8